MKATYKTKWQNHATREFLTLKEAKKAAKEMIKERDIHPNDFKGVYREYFNYKNQFISQRIC